MTVRRLVVTVAFALAAAGCGRGGGGDGAAPAPGFLDPTAFARATEGGGVFGAWALDERGRPAYDYRLDQTADDRALWANSRGRERRTHWHLVGNDRVNALATNDGTVEVADGRRTMEVWNRVDEATGNYGGGFGYLVDGAEIVCTHWADRPAGAVYDRRFEIGAATKRLAFGHWEIVERTLAPFGADPALVREIEITNRGDEARDVLWVEVWDWNLHSVQATPFAAGPLLGATEDARAAFNGNFRLTSSYDEGAGTLTVEAALAPGVAAPPREAPEARNYYPAPLVLASLDAAPSHHDADPRAFFGAGGRARPDALATGAASSDVADVDARGGPAMLGLRVPARIAPGETRRLRFLFVRPDAAAEVAALVDTYRAAPIDDAWADSLAYFAAPGAEVVQRETAWHSYYLRALATVEEYFAHRIVPQGSAYGYVQGANGAPRDFAIAAVPLAYTAPDLAKDVLRYTMRATWGDGRLSYSTTGVGQLTGAIIHEFPSDLELSFLWALAEYLAATRDFAFLDEDVPYYPLSEGRSATVRARIEDAYRRLVDFVGVGEHGLVRVLQGDWSDGIFLQARDPIAFWLRGESTYNTAFAVYLLPRLADLVERWNPDLAADMRMRAEGWRAAMEAQWQGRWYLRGWFGDGRPIGDERLQVEQSAWILAGAGAYRADRVATLVASLREALLDPSPIGALLLYPPVPESNDVYEPGWDVNGGVWAAMNGILAWGLGEVDPALGWEELRKNLLATHAEAYPEVWYGVWSGPDSYNADYARRPGETFEHVATAMNEFPVMNSNAHAAPLLALLKLAGLDARAGEIVVDPKVPFDRFSLATRTAELRWTPGAVEGAWRAASSETVAMRVRFPGARAVAVEGAPTPFRQEGDFVRFDLPLAAGVRTAWGVR